MMDVTPASAKKSVKKKHDRKIKCSHLFMQEKSLKAIPSLSASKEVVVIYMYKNNIVNIENLHVFPNLTSLYLQNNDIDKLDNLQSLKHLRKLYVSHNKISVLEGLNNMECLEELYIEKQHLPDGVSLCIDPRTVLALSETLLILNISHNRLMSLEILSQLRRMQSIDASHNDVDDIKDVCQTIRNWYNLRDAVFTGNPFTKRHRYREDIIANTYRLDNLDGKNISDVTRSFIRVFEQEKLIKGSKQSINIKNIITGLPNTHPLPLQKAVSASLLRGAKCQLSDDLKTFDEKDATYIHWKEFPKRRPHTRAPQVNRRIDDRKQAIIVNSLPKLSK